MEKFSCLSRSPRLKERNSRSRLENWDQMAEFFALVSKPEIKWTNSRARLEARDWKKENLDLVSKHETGRRKFSIPSRNTRLKDRYSRSRLEIWNGPLVGHCHHHPHSQHIWEENINIEDCCKRPSDLIHGIIILTIILITLIITIVILLTRQRPVRPCAHNSDELGPLQPIQKQDGTKVSYLALLLTWHQQIFCKCE